MFNIRLLFYQLVFAIYIVFGSNLLSKFHQSDYKVINYRVELKWFNKELVNDYRVVTFKHNRSVAAVNISFNYKIDVGTNLLALAQGYKLASNQYRLFPFRFQVNFWEATMSNVGGLSKMYDCGNIPSSHQLKKDYNYYLCNFVPNDSELPPLIPTGQYMCEVTTILDNQNLVTVMVYGEVYRP